MSKRWIILVELHQPRALAVRMTQEQKFMLYGVLAMAALCVLIGIALSM